MLKTALKSHLLIRFRQHRIQLVLQIRDVLETAERGSPDVTANYEQKPEMIRPVSLQYDSTAEKIFARMLANQLSLILKY